MSSLIRSVFRMERKRNEVSRGSSGTDELDVCVKVPSSVASREIAADGDFFLCDVDNLGDVKMDVAEKGAGFLRSEWVGRRDGTDDHANA